LGRRSKTEKKGGRKKVKRAKDRVKGRRGVGVTMTYGITQAPVRRGVLKSGNHQKKKKTKVTGQVWAGTGLYRLRGKDGAKLFGKGTKQAGQGAKMKKPKTNARENVSHAESG